MSCRVLVFISRDESASEPYFERVPLHEALVFLSEQSSGLARHPEGVVSLAKLVERCGGVWRLVTRRLRILCRWFRIC